MIIIKPYTLDDSDQWDRLVSQSITATWFQTSSWLRLFIRHFGGDLHVNGVYDGDVLIGIAPFTLSKQTFSILSLIPVLGDEMVSDFGDIIALKGREKDVWDAVFTHLKDSSFHFQFIREESPSFHILSELGGIVQHSDVSPFLDLPSTWDEYLSYLNRKDRHELKRKIRRLEEEGAFKVCHEGDPADIEEFFRLMSLSNDQKRDFLSSDMRLFFQDILKTFWKEKTLSLCFMKLNGKNIAAAVLFEYKNQVLLYNSGFDPEYSRLSPGFLLKAFLIKHAIEEKKSRFDFLRGNERYKFDLGAKERKLYTIAL